MVTKELFVAVACRNTMKDTYLSKYFTTKKNITKNMRPFLELKH
jgi:hypothetical protein